MKITVCLLGFLKSTKDLRQRMTDIRTNIRVIRKIKGLLAIQNQMKDMLLLQQDKEDIRHPTGRITLLILKVHYQGQRRATQPP